MVLFTSNNMHYSSYTLTGARVGVGIETLERNTA